MVENNAGESRGGGKVGRRRGEKGETLGGKGNFRGEGKGGGRGMNWNEKQGRESELKLSLNTFKTLGELRLKVEPNYHFECILRIKVGLLLNF